MPVLSGGGNCAPQCWHGSRSTARSFPHLGQETRAGHSWTLRNASKPGKPESRRNANQPKRVGFVKLYRRPSHKPIGIHMKTAVATLIRMVFHSICAAESGAVKIRSATTMPGGASELITSSQRGGVGLDQASIGSSARLMTP